jgi:hypothetical protein
MTKETGGPAFPHHVVCANGWAETQELQGITTRDYFAAKAMDVGMNEIKDYYGIDKDAVAKWCFEMADSMLKAREQ